MTRFEWKMKKIHVPFNIEFFFPAMDIIGKLTLVLACIMFIHIEIMPRYENYVVAKELARQEEYIKESEEKAIAEARDIIEKKEIEERIKQEALSRELIQQTIRECAKKFKIGDRIKIYDLNAPMVAEGDGYRWSIGGIDIITNIVGYKIYCASGDIYNYNEQIDKVRSKREWKDLVNMQLNGELTFTEEY